MDVIDDARFTPGKPNTKLHFRTVGSQKSRLAVFAVSRDAFTRAVICVLPATGTPERVLIGVSFRISTNGIKGYYENLHWEDPLSPALIRDFIGLLGDSRGGKVLPHWGTQVLSSKKQMALLLLVRAKPANPQDVTGELGPLITDGAFLVQAIRMIAVRTGNSFSASTIEVFTYSNAILDCNRMLAALRGHNVKAAYGIDPINPWALKVESGAQSKLFFSGQTGTNQPEFMPLERWADEPFGFAKYAASFLGPSKKFARFNYLHNYALPKYALRLGIQLSR